MIAFLRVCKKRYSPKITANFYRNDSSIVGSIWVQLEGREKRGFSPRISNLHEFISSRRGGDHPLLLCLLRLCMPNLCGLEFFRLESFPR